MLRRDQPLAIYMEGATKHPFGKMGFGVLRYSPNEVACVIDSEFAGQDIADVIETPRHAPVVGSIAEAVAKGAQALVLGIAPPGGLVPESWYPVIDEAIASGLSIVNGLHTRLAPRYPQLRTGQFVWDMRVEPEGIGVATGAARHLPNKRVLMIGTDMAIGKMTAGLEIYRWLRERSVNTEFVATGQIGITITGQGLPLDAVRVDYACGAVENEVLSASKRAASPDSVVIVEGQGALCHPGSTANLPLLRGTQPTHLVLCHRAGQSHLMKLPDVAIPPLGEYIRLYEDLASACGTFPRPVTVGVCLNTSHLPEDEALRAVEQLEGELGLPVCDPVRHGPEKVASVIAVR